MDRIAPLGYPVIKAGACLFRVEIGPRPPFGDIQTEILQKNTPGFVGVGVVKLLHVVMQLLEYKISDVATGNGSKFLAHLFRESIFDVGFPRCQRHHQACA